MQRWSGRAAGGWEPGEPVPSRAVAAEGRDSDQTRKRQLNGQGQRTGAGALGKRRKPVLSDAASGTQGCAAPSSLGWGSPLLERQPEGKGTPGCGPSAPDPLPRQVEQSGEAWVVGVEDQREGMGHKC